MRRWRWLTAGFLPVFASPPARAHGVLEGVGDFYSGLLHPLLVPAELLAVISLGLLMGASGKATCRLGLPMLRWVRLSVWQARSLSHRAGGR